MRPHRIIFVIVAAALVAALVVYLRSKHREERQPVAAPSASSSAPSAPPRDPVPDVGAAARASIAGHVVDAAKAPVANADVCVWARSSALTSDETRAPRCARSDDRGEYRVDDVYASRVDIGASAPGYRPAAYSVPDGAPPLALAAGEARTGIDLVLERGGVLLKGRVKDIAGGTVAGALLVVASSGARQSVARSDDAGEFSTWVSDGWCQVSASAPGYAHRSASTMAPGATLEILLTPASVLVGRVVEAGSDTPVAGAMVTAHSVGEFDGFGGYGSARTDAAGKFRIESLEPGRYSAGVEGLGRYGRSRESVLLGLGETSEEIVVEAHPARVVTAHVLAESSKEPCAQGGVSLVDDARKQTSYASIDQGGVARLKAVLAGTYAVEVYCEDRAAKPSYAPLKVADDDVDVTLAVVDGGRLRGSVVDADSKPVSEVALTLTPTESDPRSKKGWGMARTKADGAFDVKGLLPGVYRVVVDARGYAAPEKDATVKVEEGRDPDELRVTLGAGSEITGAVMDEDRKPIAGASVMLQGSKSWKNTTTLDDGSFTLRGVAPGEYRVLARERSGAELRAPGAKPEDPDGVRVVVAAKKNARVEVRVERRAGAIDGVVLDSSGQPVDDAFLDAERESDRPGAAAGSARRSVRWSWQRTPALTDTSGKFKLEKLSPGAYTVRAYRRGGGEAFAEHVAVGANVTLKIPTTGSIAGSVTAGRGSAPADFTIRIADRSSGYARSESFFRTGGAFTMKDLPAGKYHVAVDAAEGTAVEEVELREGEKRAGVTLALAPRATVRGRVVSLDGDPIRGMRVALSAENGAGYSTGEGDGERRNITDDDGRFQIDNAPTGRVYVSASPLDWRAGEYGYARVLVTVEPDRVNDLAPIAMAKRRVKDTDIAGDLGFSLKEQSPETKPEERAFEVSFVRPGGPAAAAGLAVGDVIESVDGHRVSGTSSYLYWPLVRVPSGTSVVLGLARGDSISVAASKLP